MANFTRDSNMRNCSHSDPLPSYRLAGHNTSKTDDDWQVFGSFSPTARFRSQVLHNRVGATKAVLQMGLFFLLGGYCQKHSEFPWGPRQSGESTEEYKGTLIRHRVHDVLESGVPSNGKSNGDGSAPDPVMTSNESHSPTGQHLMVRLAGVPFAFLDDEQALVDASIALVEDMGMHLLSVSGHRLLPQGVTVVTGLAESHLTIHTWPEKGVALMDVFTCGATDVLEALPHLISRFKSTENNTRWYMALRGEDKIPDTMTDLTMMPGNKRRVVKEQSKYQTIEVWDSATDQWDDHDLTDRKLFLDGVVQSGYSDEAIYHEMLIHPAMMAHPTGAKRVAILGGGEGATLREALKYKSVTEVAMIELDSDMIKIAKRELKQLNNCTYHAGSHYTSCFDDPRSTILATDAIKWFDDTFKDTPCTEAEGAKREDKFDVIVMDLLDPEAAPDAPFGKLLYSPGTLERLACALNDDGVLIAQIGEAPTSGSATDHNILDFKLDILQKFAKHMEPGGTFVYDVYVPTFRGNWGFFLGCKSATCAQRFMDNSARINLGLRQRLLPQAFPLNYYDGAVHHNIQMTPKAWEEAYCMQDGNQGDCDWRYSSSAEDGHESHPEAWMERTEAVWEEKNQNQVVAAKAIPKNEKLGLYDAATSLKISHRDLDELRAFAAMTNSSDYKTLMRWFDRYGYACDNVEGGQYYVSLLSMLTFVNHGCDADGKSEPNIDGHTGMDGDDDADDDDNYLWDPVQMRYAREHCAETRAVRSIKKGEVFLEDYGTFDWNDKALGKEKAASKWCVDKKD